MKNYIGYGRNVIAAAACAALLLSGCGGSGGGGGGGGGAAGGAVGSKVTVADGYIQGAIVFLDKNKNGVQDPTEPIGINTNPAIGEYTFKGISQATLNLYPIVVIVPVGAVDLDRPNQPLTKASTMTGPVGSSVITPMTTVLQSQLANNPGMTQAQAQASIKKAMGLPANSPIDLTVDYVAQKAPGGANAASYAKMHNVAQSISAVMKSNQTAIQNAAPKGTSPATIVDLLMQKTMENLATIVMKVDVAGNNFNAGTTGSVIGSAFQIDMNTLQQQLAVQQAKINKPVLALKGPSSITLVVDPAGVYVDQGATLHSNNPASIAGVSVTVGGVVDPTAVGAYVLTYDATDTNNVLASQVTRTVNVIAAADTAAPILQLLGGNVTFAAGSAAYSEQGAMALDIVDGDISNAVAISGVVQSGVPNTYTVTYNVKDAAGNAAVPLTRTVTVTALVDGSAATILLKKADVMTVIQGSVFTDPGADAVDLVEGTVAATPAGVVNTAVAGTYTITYSHTDGAGNVSTPVNRIVNVVAAADTTAPVITLNGGTAVSVNQGVAYADLGATAFDAVDKNLTAKMTVKNPVDVTTLGAYSVTYDVSDAAGNKATQVTRTVTVVAAADMIIPVLTLIGNANITIVQNTAYADAGATAFDLKDGPLTAVATSTVNTAVVGNYTVTYDVNDAAANAAVALVRNVNVIASPAAIDNTPPVVTAPAAVTIEATAATTTVTLGAATVTDNVATGLTATASPAGPYAVGVHAITWTSTADAAGNVGTATQTVTVTDITLPVVTAPAAVTLEATGATTAVTLGTATVTDAVTAGLTATASPVGPYAVGVHTITWTSAADAAGNIGTATQTVTVTDTTLPVVTAPAAVTIEATGATTAVTLGAATVADAVTAGLTATAAPAGPYPVGATTVTWTSSADAAGNVGTATQTVTVTDTTAPVVTAPAALTVEATGAMTMVNLGAATAVDLVTANLAVPPAPTPTAPYSVGTHNITWTSAPDLLGNIGVANQVLIVTDTTAPAITVATAPATIEAGLTYTDAGAAAVDLVAGNVTVTTTDTVNTAVPNAYTITYTATDGVNASTATRVITVVDTIAPVITAPAAITAFEATGAQTTVPLGVATVTDNAGATVVATPSQTSFPVGTTVVSWNAKDASGNAALVKTQSVTVVDTTPAVITLNNPTYSVLLNRTFTDPGAVASDAVDGNVSITGIGTVTTTTLGAYTVNYNYIDTAGNVATTVARTVNVVNTPDTTAPVIALLGAATVNLSVGATYIDAGVTASDNRDGNLTASVVTVNPVNMNTAATYTITYNVSDNAGNPATQLTRTVIVAPLVGGALADNQINTGNLTGANTTYANMLANNATDIEAAIGQSMTAMAGVIDNASFRALATQFTFDAGASLPTAAAAATEFNGTINGGTPPANPILVNWARNSADLLLTAVDAYALQDPGLDPVLLELSNAIARLEAVKTAGFTTQLVQGKTWDVADIDALLGVLYGQRGLIRWSRAYNWNTQTSNVNVPDMLTVNYTDAAGIVYPYTPINSNPVPIMNDPIFFTLQGSGATLLTGAHADFLAAANKDMAFYTAMLDPVRRADGTHPMIAEVTVASGNNQPQQWGPQFDQFGNPVTDAFGNQVWGPIYTPPAPTRILTTAELNQKILNAQRTIAALDTAGTGLNVGVTWPDAVATTGVVQAHKAFVGTSLTRTLLNTFEYRSSADGFVAIPNVNLSKKYNTPVISEIALPTTPTAWAAFIQPAGSQFMSLPNGTVTLVVTAYPEVVGSTQLNPILPINDATVGGILSTGIDLNAVNNHPAPVGVFPQPQTVVTYTDFPTPVVVAPVSNSLQIAKVTANAIGVVTVPVSIAGNTNAIGAVAVTVSYDTAAITALTAADITLGADAQAAGWSIQSSITPPSPGAGSIGTVQVSLFTAATPISTPAIALANINFTVNNIANPLPITVQSLSVFSSTNADISAQYSSVNGSIN